MAVIKNDRQTFLKNIYADYFRKDQSLQQYDFLTMQCFIYADFWLSNSEVLYRGKQKDKVDYYVAGYIALFVPYLTDKGKKLAHVK